MIMVYRNPDTEMLEELIGKNGALRVTAVDAAGDPVDQAQGSQLDREVVTTNYVVKTAFTGGAVGQTVRRTDIIDVSAGVATTVSVGWTVLDTGADIPPPSMANLEPVGQNAALTLAQLQSAGLATAANQVAQIGYLADIAESNDPHAGLKFSNSEEVGDTTYVLKTAGTRWLMTKIISTTTTDTATYATVLNNAGVTAGQAWALRATLVYGVPEA